MNDLFEKFLAAIPKLKRSIQLLGVIVIAATVIATQVIPQEYLKGAVYVGAIGVFFLIFGFFFEKIDMFPKKQRGPLLLTLTMMLVVMVLGFSVLATIFVTSAYLERKQPTIQNENVKSQPPPIKTSLSATSKSNVDAKENKVAESKKSEKKQKRIEELTSLKGEKTGILGTNELPVFRRFYPIDMSEESKGSVVIVSNFRSAGPAWLLRQTLLGDGWHVFTADFYYAGGFTDSNGDAESIPACPYISGFVTNFSNLVDNRSLNQWLALQSSIMKAEINPIPTHPKIRLPAIPSLFRFIPMTELRDDYEYPFPQFRKGVFYIFLPFFQAGSCEEDDTLVPSFTSSVVSGVAPLSVSFDASASIGGTEYIWDFGDRSDGDGKNVEHVYNLPGEYVVVLIIQGSDGYREAVSEVITVGDGVIAE